MMQSIEYSMQLCCMEIHIACNIAVPCMLPCCIHQEFPKFYVGILVWIKDGSDQIC